MLEEGEYTPSFPQPFNPESLNLLAQEPEKRYKEPFNTQLREQLIKWLEKGERSK